MSKKLTIPTCFCALIIVLVAFLKRAPDPLLLGIDLGSSQIFTAYDGAEGPVALTVVKTSAAYKNLMLDTWHNKGKRERWLKKWYLKGSDGSLTLDHEGTLDTIGMEKIFYDNLKHAVAAAKSASRRSVRLAAIAVPDHFNETSENMVQEAARRLDPAMSSRYRFRKSVRASALLFSHRGCPPIPEAKPYELPQTEKDTEVLIVSHNFGQLSFSEVDVDWWSARLINVRIIEDDAEGLRSVFNSTLAFHYRMEPANIVLSGDAEEIELREVSAIVHNLIEGRDGMAEMTPFDYNFVPLVRRVWHGS